MALSKPLHSVLEEELECGICLDKLKNPRLLTCHHSFCETCLDGCANGSATKEPKVECPVCRYTTNIPQTGVSGLRPDFRANTFLIALEEEQKRKVKMGSRGSKCSLCDADDAADFCVECDQNMCTVCSQIHKKMPVCRDHTLYPLHEVLSGKSRAILSETSTSKCSKHRHDNERVKLYCKTCNTPICADCTVLDHNKADGHACVSLKEVMPQLRRDLQELVVQVRAKEGELQAFDTDMDTTKQALAARCDLVNQRVTEEVAKIKDTLHSQINLFKETALGNLHCIREENDSNKKAVGNVLTVLNQANSSNDDVEVAVIYESLRESAQSVVIPQLDREDFDSVQLAVETFDLMLIHPNLKLVQTTRSVAFLDIPDDTKLHSMSLSSRDEIAVTLNNRETISSKLIKVQKPVIPITPAKPIPHGEPVIPPTLFKPADMGMGPGGFDMWVNPARPVPHGIPAIPATPAKPVIPATPVKTAPHVITATPLPGFLKKTSYNAQPGVRNQYKFTTGRKVVPFTARSLPGLGITMPNGQIYYVLGGQLYRDKNCMGKYQFLNRYYDIAHDSSNNVYLVRAFAGRRNKVYMVPPNCTTTRQMTEIHTREIIPNRVAACPDSPESILVAQLQPATVLRFNIKRGKIICSIREPDGSSWEKVAIASDDSDNVYVLSSVNSKCSLRVFNENGRLLQRIFTNRPEPSSTTTADNSPLKGESLGSRLSVAALPDGSMIAAYIGGQKILVITRVEKDVYRAPEEIKLHERGRTSYFTEHLD